MVGLEIRFDLGRYHANPWSSHVNDAATEWPPSPWRLIRGLYATSRTNTRFADAREAVDQALSALIAAPPPVYELPPATSGHTRHYMPSRADRYLDKRSTDNVLDGFFAVHPNAPLRVWWDADLDAAGRDALGAVAPALGYLGRSESVCTAAAIDSAPAGAIDLAMPIEGSEDPPVGELVELMCPDPDATLDDLVVSVTELRKARHLLPARTRTVTYAVPHVEVKPPRMRTRRPSHERPTLALFRLGGSKRPALTEAVAIGERLRAGLQGCHGRRTNQAASATFSGRSGEEPRSDQHRHAHYLALPEPDGRRIDRLLVWAPEGFGGAEVAALADLTFVKAPERGRPTGERLQCVLAALGTERDLSGIDILAESREWVSLTPFGLVRHPKRRRGTVVDGPEEQVVSELAHRGFPEPSRIEFVNKSWHRFRSAKTGQSRLERARLYGLHLKFAEPQCGPIAIGALSHYGLGLMTPAKPR